MNFTYENQGTTTYLVYKIEDDDILDTMSLGMLTNNKIPGLASTLFMQMDMTKYIKYNVSAKISVSQFFEGSVNQKRLIGVFTGIVDAMLSAEDYMIDADSILLDLDHIFADVTTCETVLICLPLLDTASKKVDLGTFFKNIMFSTRFDQTENCDYVAKIINYLNSTPIFSLVDFKELLEAVKGTKSIALVQTLASEQESTSAVLSSPQKVQQNVQPTVSTPQTSVISQQPIVNAGHPAQQSVSFAMQTPPMQFSGIPVSVAPQKMDETKVKKKGMFGFFKSSGKEDKENKKQHKESEKQKKETEKKKDKGETSVGFKVPGAPAFTPSFAIPRSAGNAGFAIPGQASAPISQPSVKQTSSVTGGGIVSNNQQQNVRPAQQQVIQNQTSTTSYHNTYNSSYQQPQAPQGHSMNFGETTVLSAGIPGETTVLNLASAPVEIKPFLIRKKNSEKIFLNKPVFRIGKERSYVDYFIGDNTAISRSHANIISKDGEYFVMDTNSTNHTYVSGTMIQSNVEVKLEHGIKIRLANEEFEFWLY